MNLKRQKIEPKSATLHNHQDYIKDDIEKHRIIGSDEHKKIGKRENHSLDRKVEVNLNDVSCSSSDNDEDGSSDDSDEENGSKSSSSSSSGDSDSSLDPILDTQSKDGYQADCLNIIDSYESQQKENDYQ